MILLKMCKALNKHPVAFRAIINYNCPAALLVGVAIVTTITQLEKAQNSENLNASLSQRKK